MISKKSVIYRFLCIWWVLITMAPRNRVFAIYQIMLSWKTYKYCRETDELPNRRPTQQPEKKSVKSGIWATFLPQRMVFRGLGFFFFLFVGKQTGKKPSSNQVLRKHPSVKHVVN